MSDPEALPLPNPEVAGNLSPDGIFTDFTWQERMKPEAVGINEAGFAEDAEGYWYLVRKARQAKELTEVTPEDLYNGPYARYWNSTEGQGLYFANHPDAVTKLKLGVRQSKEPSELYVCRTKVEPEQLLDVMSPLSKMEAGQRAAAILLKSRSVFPGIPSPTRKTYDRIYGDAAVVTTPPLALSRLMTGNKVDADGQRTRIRWAIVRDPSILEIVAHRSVQAG